ncbi:MAG: reverse transcriptase family protein, partial [Candidatus Thiodiazotropha endolucinida]|nr:reverse transcriptase family protein [Candidatus Thiodiazotropha taylori]MCW4261998.1 reverse transcriptase family protein [Candidatus Thiodiazotropha endolucinida]
KTANLFVYRRPFAKADWIEKFSKQIEAAISSCSEIYLMGDFNINIDEGKITNSNWKAVIELGDLKQVIKEPTRVTAHSEKLIDHVYASALSNVAESFVPCIAISDHYPVCFTRKVSKNQIKRGHHKTIQYRCYKTFDEQRFLENLSEVLNNINFSQNNTDLNFSIWLSSFQSVLDKHAPIRRKRVKHETQPEWYNEDIKLASKSRDFYHKHKNWNEYKFWRNKTNKLILASKKELFTKAIKENKDTSYLWRHVKKHSGQSSYNDIPDELTVDGDTINSPNSIINRLNSYFANISERLKIHDASHEYDFQKLQNYINNLIPSHVFFKIPTVNISELINTIKSLNVSKATGLDGLSPKILKLSASVIAPSLLEIINSSIAEGCFPDSLKVSKLKPIHKGGPQHDPSNYRPISILPVLSKLVEKHVTKHIFAFLNKYNVLHKAQSGFRKYHSCQTAMINLIDKWLKSIDNGESIGAIFFDLRKAFDVVDHDLLLKKLVYYKFNDLSQNWMKSYLTNRKQCIVAKNVNSEFQTVKSGVPQGSVLGPVLFLLFINDMPLFTNGTEVDIYADDTTMHSANKHLNTVAVQLQSGTSGFHLWCKANKMHVHIQKTAYMTLSSRQNVSHEESIEIYIDNEIIQTVEQQKLLGIIIDRTLCWDKQIDAVCSNVTRRITLLKHLSKYVDKESMNQYYNSYILPILDYGCLIWGRCSNFNTLRILKLQKRAARIILKADIFTPSRLMFKELNWLTFPNRVQYHTCNMVYKALMGLAPEYLCEMFIKVSDTHNRSLRSVKNELLRIPCSRTKIYENSFIISAAKIWNEIPFNIRHSKNIDVFKKDLKTYLHDSQ